MKPVTQRRLQQALNTVITESTSRLASTGETHHRFIIEPNDLGLQRVQHRTVNAVCNTLGQRNITTSFSPSLGGFEIEIDLDSCTLSAEQSRNVQIARSSYYVS